LEAAPKDILGDFPRMTAEGARAIVDAVESERLRNGGRKSPTERRGSASGEASGDDELSKLAERRPTSSSSGEKHEAERKKSKSRSPVEEKQSSAVAPPKKVPLLPTPPALVRPGPTGSPGLLGHRPGSLDVDIRPRYEVQILKA
jgi:hypothetical protein